MFVSFVRLMGFSEIILFRDPEVCLRESLV